jgi:hypothetical protein
MLFNEAIRFKEGTERRINRFHVRVFATGYLRFQFSAFGFRSRIFRSSNESWTWKYQRPLESFALPLVFLRPLSLQDIPVGKILEPGGKKNDRKHSVACGL